MARRRDRRLDPELALALARLRVAFGHVEVLQVRPNPPPSRSADGRCRSGPTVEQAVLDLDTTGPVPPGPGADSAGITVHPARQGA